jgi:hypothetical protein
MSMIGFNPDVLDAVRAIINDDVPKSTKRYWRQPVTPDDGFAAAPSPFVAAKAGPAEYGCGEDWMPLARA